MNRQTDVEREKMKVETAWLYLSIDLEGFYFELCNLDVEHTPVLTLAFIRDLDKPDVERDRLSPKPPSILSILQDTPATRERPKHRKHV